MLLFSSLHSIHHSHKDEMQSHSYWDLITKPINYAKVARWFDVSRDCVYARVGITSLKAFTHPKISETCQNLTGKNMWYLPYHVTFGALNTNIHVSPHELVIAVIYRTYTPWYPYIWVVINNALVHKQALCYKHMYAADTLTRCAALLSSSDCPEELLQFLLHLSH